MAVRGDRRTTGLQAQVGFVIAELVAAAADWQEAQGSWLRARQCYETVASREAAKVVAATGGLGLQRWAAACRRRRANTVADAVLCARAWRARPAVEQALAAQAKALAEQAGVLAAAEEALAGAAARLGRFGDLGAGPPRSSSARPAACAPRPANRPSTAIGRTVPVRGVGARRARLRKEPSCLSDPKYETPNACWPPSPPPTTKRPAASRKPWPDVPKSWPNRTVWWRRRRKY